MNASARSSVCYPIMGNQRRYEGGFRIFSARVTTPSSRLLSTISTKHHTKQQISLHARSWISSFGDDKACEAEHYRGCRGAFEVAVALDAIAKEDQHMQDFAKCNHQKMQKEKNPRRLSSSVSPRAPLDCYQIFKYPLVTESAMSEMIKKNTLVFVVDKDANKRNIKEAARMMFGCETKKVNTLVMPDGQKKAYLSLKSNHNAVEIAKKLKAL